jgi:hypothetical protein
MPSRAQKNRKYPAPPPTPEGYVWGRTGLVPAWAWQEAAQQSLWVSGWVNFRHLDTGQDYDLADRLKSKRKADSRGAPGSPPRPPRNTRR